MYQYTNVPISSTEHRKGRKSLILVNSRLFQWGFLFSVLFSHSCSSPKNIPPATFSEFDEVLGILKKNSFYRNSINWQDFQSKVDSIQSLHRPDSLQVFCTYFRLNEDKHSFLLTPKTTWLESFTKPEPVPEATPAIEAYMTKERVAVIKLQYCGWDTAVFTPFVAKIRDSIATLNDNNPDGWVLDIQDNEGGNMWPALAGLFPFFNTDTIGYDVYPDSTYYPLFFQSDRVNPTPEFSFFYPEWPNKNILKDKKLAILINSKTASAAEGIAHAFKGQKNVKFFGQPTAGYSTATMGYPLRNGKIFVISIALMATRDKIVYPEKRIEPDFFTIQEPRERAIKWILD